ncbi:MAG TPA: ATP-binding protein [Thermoanaerobaculia bacterium]
MITLVEALNYRCLRYIRQPLGPFHVLVGPNASGKTTFLDVIAFLGRLVSDGVDAAIEERSQNFYDLVWRHQGMRFELAIEAKIPQELQERLLRPNLEVIRYEVVVGLEARNQERGIRAERVILKRGLSAVRHTEQLFSASSGPPSTLAEASETSQDLISVDKNEGSGRLYAETAISDLKGWKSSSNRSLRRSHIRSLDLDESLFPATSWLRDLLMVGVQQIVLNSLLMRKPSPPGKGLSFKADGSNLPWVVEELRQRSLERFRQWIAHLQTAFPDLQDIKTIERPEDRHRYLILQYSEGLEVPSWMASDGTLRMLALTLPAYLEGFKGIYLIEEPENGIHPRAIETMTQSLSSVYDAQVLLATHSPVILSTVEAEQILCFSKTPEGATDIIRGSEHPALQSWKHETSLGTLFAAGVLG